MSAKVMAGAVKWGDANLVLAELYSDAILVSGVKGRRVPVVYNILIIVMSILAVFFAVSLWLAVTSQFMLDWGSALVGLLGTTGLAVVGWLSKRQILSDRPLNNE